MPSRKKKSVKKKVECDVNPVGQAVKSLNHLVEALEDKWREKDRELDDVQLERDEIDEQIEGVKKLIEELEYLEL